MGTEGEGEGPEVEVEVEVEVEAGGQELGFWKRARVVRVPEC